MIRSTGVIPRIKNTSKIEVASLPPGGGLGRVFKVGNQPINSRLEAYYNVEQPDGAPEWNFQFTWQFLFPKK